MSPRPALLVLAVVFAILNADITTVKVALVTVGKDLHSELEDLQWGLNSYDAGVCGIDSRGRAPR